MTKKPLQFYPPLNIEWTQEDMHLMVEYIQYIRRISRNIKADNGEIEINPDFHLLAQDFKDHVHQAYVSGRLAETIEIFHSQMCDEATWEILPSKTGLSVWTNVFE